MKLHRYLYSLNRTVREVGRYDRQAMGSATADESWSSERLERLLTPAELAQLRMAAS
ncbi:MAG: hypothetical protein HOQ24_03425 [Mycobacteriaceae bacterium]|nr:hypothetical protein [Mycobacteriaceae bacterium]